MHRFTRGILIVAMGLACWAGPAQSDDYTNDMTATDRLLRRADKAFMQNQREVAVQLYGATIKAYEDILSRQGKARASDLLAVRIAYCNNQIMALLSPRPAPRQREQTSPAALPTARPPEAISAPLSALPVAVEVEQAVALCRMGQFKQARSLIITYLVDHEKDPYALLMLATAALGQGDMQVAGESLAACLELAPMLPEVHYNISQLILRSGNDFEKAAHHYRRSVELGGARDSDLADVLGVE